MTSLKSIVRDSPLIGPAARKLRKHTKQTIKEFSSYNRQQKKKSITDLDSYLSQLDRELLNETKTFYERFRVSSSQKIKDKPVAGGTRPGVGGAGSCYTLYFFTRYLKPDSVIETGVAAGWSSGAILSGLQKNNKGHLFSSDLPYSERGQQQETLKPEDIGCIVDSELSRRWTLCKEGDKKCIPSLVENIESAQLVHYDSDKSYEGRAFAVKHLIPLLKPGSLFIMDDIKDNSFFLDWVTSNNHSFTILPKTPNNKGMIGLVWL